MLVGNYANHAYWDYDPFPKKQEQNRNKLISAGI